MNSKRYLPVILFFILMFAGLTGVYAYYYDSVQVTNHLELGDVNIELAEYEIENGMEIPYQNSKMVLPGQMVSKIPRITNCAQPCWIRVRLTYENSMEGKDGTVGLGDQHLYGMNQDWVKIGNYYYYTKILETDQDVDLFQGIQIPAAWTESHSFQELKVHIWADAIQAANFSPDFDGDAPWGEEEIQLCVHGDGEILETGKESIELSVEFSGASYRLLAAPDNFFNNMPVLLPGDSYSDSISLFNTTDSEAELFFHVDVPEKKDEDVLSHIGLSIHMQEEEIYKGNLISEELHRAISLGKYQPEEQGKLTFTLNVPPDMDNQYALEQAKVKWNFSVQKTDEPAKNAEDSDQTGEHTTSVRTGDSSGIEMYLLLFFGAFVLASLLVVVKRGVKKNENTDS